MIHGFFYSAFTLPAVLYQSNRSAICFCSQFWFKKNYSYFLLVFKLYSYFIQCIHLRCNAQYSVWITLGKTLWIKFICAVVPFWIKWIFNYLNRKKWICNNNSLNLDLTLCLAIPWTMFIEHMLTWLIWLLSEIARVSTNDNEI